MLSRSKAIYVFCGVCALVALLAVPTVFLPWERQRYLNARIGGLLENLKRRPGEITSTDLAGYELERTIDLAKPEEVTLDTIDRMATMLLSDDTLIRQLVARALDGLGPSATRSPRVLPALRRAIAEELQYRRSTSPFRSGPPDLVLNAQIVALSSITGVPYDELWEHPEQFEQLPPDMALCRSMNSPSYCDQLLAEWRAEHPEDSPTSAK